MAQPHPKRRQQPRLDPNRGNRPPDMVDLVDPAWIIKALAATFAVAILCAYITVCILFSHSQWQLVLHPSHSVPTTPASLNLPFTEVHFGVDSSGQPQLDGWWIPAPSPGANTALLLHSGDGSMSDALPEARTLHNAGLNVLLFDYRGFGRSGGQHPAQPLMQADTESALRYLNAARSIPNASIVPFGTGLGASLAVKLCADHHNLPALILESPDGDMTTRVRADTHSHLAPVSLLFNQDFPLADPLHTLATPKLLITYTEGQAPTELQRAADPKTTLELPTRNDTALQQAVTRFLSTYTTTAPSLLIPNSTP